MSWSVRIGPVSEGTLKNEDLIPTFLEEVNNLSFTKAMEICKEYKYDPANDEDFDFESGEAVFMVEALIEALEELNPLPFTHFGAHEGDGAMFGFWPNDPNDIADFSDGVMKVNAGAKPEFILSVNDHGNVTLFRVELQEVWSIV